MEFHNSPSRHGTFCHTLRTLFRSNVCGVRKKRYFRALFTICDRVEEQGHKPLLRTFVRDHFVAKESAEGTTHAAICRYLPEVVSIIPLRVCCYKW